MSVIEKDNHDYIGYDYYSMKVDKQKVSMYIDYYESFGWTLEDHDIYKEEISNNSLDLNNPSSGVRNPGSGNPSSKFR